MWIILNAYSWNVRLIFLIFMQIRQDFIIISNYHRHNCSWSLYCTQRLPKVFISYLFASTVVVKNIPTDRFAKNLFYLKKSAQNAMFSMLTLIKIDWKDYFWRSIAINFWNSVINMFAKSLHHEQLSNCVPLNNFYPNLPIFSHICNISQLWP